MDQFIKLAYTLSLITCLALYSSLIRAEPPTTNNTSAGEVGVIGGSVARSTFTLAVVKREPKEPIKSLTTDQHHIYYFTELKGMAGQSVRHRWVYNNQVMAEVKFEVGASRWRVWSSKTLLTEWTGTWKVEVINELDQVVWQDSFEYVAQSNTEQGAPQ